jgi:hypothetical protein
MAEAAPKLDLGAIQAGSALKHVEPAGADAGLAHASVLAAIQGQGVISAQVERVPVNNDGLNRALILNEIGKQGVISAVVEGEKKPDPALQQALILNAIAHQGVISVPDGAAPDRALTDEQKAALLAEAAAEKKDIAEGLAQQKAKFNLGDVVGEHHLKHVETAAPATGGLDRGNLLHELAAATAGGKAVDPAKIPAAAAADSSLVQASILSAIKSQGVISVPEGSAPDRSLTDEQKAALLAEASAEKKVEAEAAVEHKAKLDLSGLGAAQLKHVDEPVVDNSATLAHAGLLNELAKKT